jgi:hypothetical protein
MSFRGEAGIIGVASFLCLLTGGGGVGGDKRTNCSKTTLGCQLLYGISSTGERNRPSP